MAARFSRFRLNGFNLQMQLRDGKNRKHSFEFNVRDAKRMKDKLCCMIPQMEERVARHSDCGGCDYNQCELAMREQEVNNES